MCATSLQRLADWRPCLVLPCLAHSLFPVSPTGAVAHVGGKGEAFVYYVGDLISFFNCWKNYFGGDYMQCRFIFA